ncbi:MAG: CheR family methyltransferase [Bacteroidota bacterium]
MTRPLPEQILLRVREFIADTLGLQYPEERWNELERAITAAALEFGYTDVQRFVQHIVSTPLKKVEIDALTAHLMVHETYFWREPAAFAALEQYILPELISSRQKEKRIRIWSAGCSTGEEPYSLAMALHRAIPEPDVWNITLLATDISPQMVHRAEAGLYGERSFRSSPEWLKEKYFTLKGQDTYEIVPEIKRMVSFQYLNLVENIYPSMLNDTNAMDIIYCRNVLMYFTENRRSQVVRGLFNSLLPGGYLVVSANELSLQSLSQFDAVNYPEMVLYQKQLKMQKIPTHVQAAIFDPLLIENMWPLDPVHSGKVVFPQHQKSGNGTLSAIQSMEKKDSRYDKAVASYVQGNYPEVISQLHPGEITPDERMLLIRAYANQGLLEKALHACNIAIEADRLNPRLQYLYATLLQEDQQLKEAMSVLKRAIYLDPNFVLAYYSLGKIYQRLGNRKSATKCTENVLSILKTCSQDEILYESEGLTAGRLKEILMIPTFTRE